MKRDDVDLSDEALLRIWTKQAYEMGLIDTKIPVRKSGAFGMTLAERKRIRAQCDLIGAPDPFLKFNQQKRTAAERGIEWELTFPEWWALWEPYFKQRGHQGHGLEMCRKGDMGPYSAENVFIASGLENREMTIGQRKRARRRRQGLDKDQFEA